MPRSARILSLLRVLLAMPILALGLAFADASMDAAPAQAAEVDDEAAFVARINALRIANNLEPLLVDTELVTTSRSWAIQLRSDGALSHADDLSIGVTAEWAKLGENVGVAGTEQFEELFAAFVASPLHYANLVDPDFTHIGTGVVYDSEGRMWTAHRFMDKVAEPTATTAPSTSTTSTSALAPDPTTTPTNQSTTTSAATATTTASPTPTTTTPTSSSTPPSSDQAVSELIETHRALSPIPARPIDRTIVASVLAELAG